MWGRDGRVLIRALVVVLLAIVSPARRAAAFVTFEAGQVRPLALSPDGQTLLALNTPDARLEIFTVAGGDISPRGSVPVGLEPVAVAARTNSEVWVVNHLSDSVSIVDIASTPPRVVRTLLVGDEPRDIVFAGPRDVDGHFGRAFITTARLGQNLPDSVPLHLTTPGTPRALVYVFDANNLGAQKGERNRCRAVSAAKIQGPQGPRHPEGLNDGFSRLTHEGGNPSKVTLLPQRFVRIHLYSFHSSCR